MRKIELIISFVLLIGVLYLYTNFIFSPKKPIKEMPILRAVLLTDKNLYHAGEKVNLNLTILSFKKLENITILAYGIPTEENLLWFKNVRNERLHKGENIFQMHFSLPKCLKCEKIRAGEYPITAMVYFLGKIINSTKNITLVE